MTTIDSQLEEDHLDAVIDSDPGQEPRSTADFLNDMWLTRRNPVYVLSNTEQKILASKTVKGLIWRLIVWALRHKKGKASLGEMTGTLPTPEAIHGHYPGEDTMGHYLRLNEQFNSPKPDINPLPTPKPTAITDCTCNCTFSKPVKKRTPRKFKKKSQKRPLSKKNKA